MDLISSPTQPLQYWLINGQHDFNPMIIGYDSVCYQGMVVKACTV